MPGRSRGGCSNPFCPVLPQLPKCPPPCRPWVLCTPFSLHLGFHPKRFDCERRGWGNIPGCRWLPLTDDAPRQPSFPINFIPSSSAQTETLISHFPVPSCKGRRHGAPRHPREHRLLAPCVGTAPAPSSSSPPGFCDGETSEAGSVFQEGF